MVEGVAVYIAALYIEAKLPRLCLVLTSHMTGTRLSRLRSLHRRSTGSEMPSFFWISPVFPLCPFSVLKFNSIQR